MVKGNLSKKEFVLVYGSRRIRILMWWQNGGTAASVGHGRVSAGS